MISSDVIVVGGGPAGSTCAWKLREAGVETIVLDRKSFPRPKPCAGWITPRALRTLELDENSYPLGIRRITRLTFHFPFVTIPLPTLQYAIRRLEFDDWLLKRAGVPVHNHEVKQIRKQQAEYVIDDLYRCRILVGAGGTVCPVYRMFFQDLHPRSEKSLITALECEFPQPGSDPQPRLWFGENNLPGYSWYFPKDDDYVNIGVGAHSAVLKDRKENIRQHWENLIRRLTTQSYLKNPAPEFRGYSYYLRTTDGPVQREGCYILGDAAGLATRDMGEGIGPAVESGIGAARAILSHTEYSLRSIAKRSVLDLLLPRRH